MLSGLLKRKKLQISSLNHVLVNCISLYHAVSSSFNYINHPAPTSCFLWEEALFHRCVSDILHIPVGNPYVGR